VDSTDTLYKTTAAVLVVRPCQLGNNICCSSSSSSRSSPTPESYGPLQARSVHMGQIRLLLFARNDMYAAISHIEKGSQVGEMRLRWRGGDFMSRGVGRMH